MNDIFDIPSEELPVGFSVEFKEPLDCTGIFPEGDTATGAQIEDDGRFSLVGAGQGRVIGQLDGLTPENAEELIINNILGAAHLSRP